MESIQDLAAEAYAAPRDAVQDRLARLADGFHVREADRTRGALQRVHLPERVLEHPARVRTGQSSLEGEKVLRDGVEMLLRLRPEGGEEPRLHLFLLQVPLTPPFGGPRSRRGSGGRRRRRRP